MKKDKKMGKRSQSEITYTVKEMLATIYDKMEHSQQIQEEILTQTRVTNGRVTKLEGNPFIRLGCWMVENPFKTIVFALLAGIIINAWFVSDFRQPILEIIGGLI